MTEQFDSEYVFVKRQHHARLQKKKALEPKRLHCKILDIDVNVLIEYWDYQDSYSKGYRVETYCENMTFCYYNNIKCRYSGISSLYPDPFDRNFNDEFYKAFVGEEEFNRIKELREKLKSDPTLTRKIF